MLVKKTEDNNFKSLKTEGGSKKIIAESSSFKIFTYGKNSPFKEINISRESGNIVITSEKGKATPQHVFKKQSLISEI